MECYKQPQMEKGFLAEMFSQDAKNYHAWSCRIWLVEEHDMWDGEFAFIEDLISEDPMNNSAWSYRYFLIAKQKEFSIDTIREEVDYALSKITNVEERENEAIWTYVRGFFATSPEAVERS